MSVGVGLGLAVPRPRGSLVREPARDRRRERPAGRGAGRSDSRSTRCRRTSLRALACPASFKGVLSAAAAAEALCDGLRAGGRRRGRAPGCRRWRGDGRDAARGARRGMARGARSPTRSAGRVRARWLVLPDGRAVVEAAAAIGLPLLAPDERDPLRASSRGFGELIAAALADGATGLLLGLGGSATVDGGAGLRRVARLAAGAGGRPLRREHASRRCGAALRPAERRVARGRAGARASAWPPWRSSGRTPTCRDRVRPVGWVRRWRRSAPSSSRVPSAILDAVGFDDRLNGCDLVVTGEGTVDVTTAEGKAPGAVARRCAAAGVRCVVVGGVVEAPVAAPRRSRCRATLRAAQTTCESSAAASRARLGGAPSSPPRCGPRRRGSSERAPRGAPTPSPGCASTIGRKLHTGSR